mmetsp:Transcript_16975/g.48248  ORF Transcript_16975/g.48248 Transcript_16975/m.48248 type:complete len:355 (+) Transcript_16975:2-1066(+)
MAPHATSPASATEPLVGGRFVVGRKIGAGSFGDIYMGRDAETGEEVAIKFEPMGSPRPQLHYEEKLYTLLRGGAGVPSLHWFGREGDRRVLVLDLLGPSLEDLLNFCKRRLSVQTVCMLADQMLRRLEWLHSKGYIHRDMKPDNFVIGLGDKANLVHLIDYGLAKRYREAGTYRHISYREGKNLTGTARYASLNTHLGIEQSRRDDLEALGNVLVYLIRGRLPWQGLPSNNKLDKYEQVTLKKQKTTVHALCKGLPREFETYLNYCRGLSFEEQPDYNYLRGLFRSAMESEGGDDDFVFDWFIHAECASEQRLNTSGAAQGGEGEDEVSTTAAAGAGAVAATAEGAAKKVEEYE